MDNQTQSSNKTPKLISTEQACIILGKSRNTLISYRRQGIIQPFGNSPHHRFDEAQLLADFKEFRKGKYYK